MDTTQSHLDIPQLWIPSLDALKCIKGIFGYNGETHAENRTDSVNDSLRRCPGGAWNFFVIEMSDEEAIELAVASWRLMYSYEENIEKMPSSFQRAAHAKAKHLFGRITRHLLDMLWPRGILLITYEGKPYTPNYPIEAVNAKDFDANNELVVSATLEPALVQKGRVLHPGKVVLVHESHSNRE